MIENILLLSGSPGTGKTTIAKFLSEKSGVDVISLSPLVKIQNLYDEVDEERDTKIVDEKRLKEYIQAYIQKHKGDLIIEGHYADLIDHPSVSAAIVLRCHPLELEKRLSSRGYSKEKVEENIQAELVGSCTSYMLEHNSLPEQDMYEIDTTHNSIQIISEIVYLVLKKNKKLAKNVSEKTKLLKIGTVSWLSDQSVPSRFFLT